MERTATDTLRDSFRARLDLPDGRIGAVAAVHTFGGFLSFHPHLHLLAADGLFTPDGRFHCMPAESYAQMAELFRHRLLRALREAKLISPGKLTDLLSWQHSGFNVDGGKRPVPAHHTDGRKRLGRESSTFLHPQNHRSTSTPSSRSSRRSARSRNGCPMTSHRTSGIKPKGFQRLEPIPARPQRGRSRRRPHPGALLRLSPARHLRRNSRSQADSPWFGWGAP